MTQATLRKVGLVFVTLFFGGGGILHFIAADRFAKTIPFLPYPMEVVYITGVIEIVAVVLLWIPRHRQWVGTALFIYTICVTPANLFMLLRPDLFPDFGMTYHVLRLSGQVLLLWIIWWSSRMPTLKSAEAMPQIV